jgi:hypothetical protein
MTSAAAPSVLPGVHVGPSPLEAETERLRGLLDRQPCCLLRVGMDGLLLAANEAALSQLAARELGKTLGRLLTEWILPEHRNRWCEFAARVRERGSGSLECILVDLDGVQHAVSLRGVSIEHPDGIPSLLVVARNINETQRLEAALQDQAGTRQALLEVQQRLERSLAEQQRLHKLIDSGGTEHQHLLEQALAEQQRLQEVIESSEAEYQQRLLAERARIQAVAEERHLELMLKDREARRRFDQVQHELDQARAEQSRLAAELADRDSRLQQQLGAQAAESGLLEQLHCELDQAHAERLRLEAALADQESTKQQLLAAQALECEQLEQLQAELDEAQAERLRLEASLAERDCLQQQQLAAHEAECHLLRQAASEQCERALADGRQQLAILQRELELADTERLRLEQLVAEVDARRNALVAQQAEERAELDRALAAAVREKEQALKALADQWVELQALDENVRSLEPLAGAGRLSLQVARELRIKLEAVDGHAKALLAGSDEASPDREKLGELLMDASRAASLARQIVTGGSHEEGDAPHSNTGSGDGGRNA